MSSSPVHDALRNEILLAVSESKLALLWPYEVGLARQFHNPERVVKLGVNGISDLIGVLCDGSGRFVGVEIKTGVGKLQKSQVNFKGVIQKFNGVFIEARSASQVLEELKAVSKIRVATSI